MLFLALVAFQVLVLVGMAAGRESTLQDDDNDVTLQTVPVDPHDLFRGDFVVLRYDIGTIRTDGLEIGGEAVEVGDTIYVALAESERGEWAVIDAATGIRTGWDRYLRGTVLRVDGGLLEAEYGIEEYFVPEGLGREVEQAGDVDVVVAIDGSGRGVIRHLIVDGEVWDPHA
jgi:uncharacterized membrane-anchored protein